MTVPNLSRQYAWRVFSPSGESWGVLTALPDDGASYPVGTRMERIVVDNVTGEGAQAEANVSTLRCLGPACTATAEPVAVAYARDSFACVNGHDFAIDVREPRVA